LVSHNTLLQVCPVKKKGALNPPHRVKKLKKPNSPKVFSFGSPAIFSLKKTRCFPSLDYSGFGIVGKLNKKAVYIFKILFTG
jgi:hypothetical protein